MQPAVRFVREKPHGVSGGVAHGYACHGQMPSDEHSGAHTAELVALSVGEKSAASLRWAHCESLQPQCLKHSWVRLLLEKPHGASGRVVQSDGAHGQMPSDEQTGAQRSASVPPTGAKVSLPVKYAQWSSVQPQCWKQVAVRFVVEKPQGASGAVGQSEGAHDHMPSVAHFAAHRSAAVPSALPTGAPVSDTAHWGSAQPQSW
jgi:hypothetical protein